MYFCPQCDGNTYIGQIGVNERRCPTCDGAGILTKRGRYCDECSCMTNHTGEQHREAAAELPEEG